MTKGRQWSTLWPMKWRKDMNKGNLTGSVVHRCHSLAVAISHEYNERVAAE